MRVSLWRWTLALTLTLAVGGAGKAATEDTGGGAVGPEDTPAAAADVAAPEVTPGDVVAVELVADAVCTPGASAGCVDNYTASVCAPDGSGWVDQSCRNDETGGGICLDDACTVCTPGQRRCADDEHVESCDESGQVFSQVEDCHGAATGRICTEGICTRLCELAVKFKN